MMTNNRQEKAKAALSLACLNAQPPETSYDESSIVNSPVRGKERGLYSVLPFSSYFEVYGGRIDAENKEEGAQGAITSNYDTKRSVYPSKQYIIVLQVLSLFPCAVELDDLSIVYKEYTHCDYGDVLLDSFKCSTCGQDTERLVLHPGVMKAIPLPFTAPSSSSTSRRGDWRVLMDMCMYIYVHVHVCIKILVKIRLS